MADMMAAFAHPRYLTKVRAEEHRFMDMKRSSPLRPKTLLAEKLVAGARERRMTRDNILDIELAEPAVSKGSPALTRDHPLGGSQTSPYDQHRDHQFRIDRWETHGTFVWGDRGGLATALICS
jgi:hypothetical protein